MRQIDEFVFKQTDVFKTSFFHQKLVSLIGELPAARQKMVGQAITITVICIPLIFVFVLFFGNIGMKSDLEMKKEILALSNEYLNQKAQVSMLSGDLLSPIPISSRTDFQERLKAALDSKKIDNNKIVIEDFKGDSSSKTIKRTEADLAFTGFSINEFSNILTVLIEDFKSKVSIFSVTKNQKTSLLSGRFHLIHYGRMEKKYEDE